MYGDAGKDRGRIGSGYRRPGMRVVSLGYLVAGCGIEVFNLGFVCSGERGMGRREGLPCMMDYSDEFA